MPATGATYAPTITTLENSSADSVSSSDALDLYSLVPYPEDYWTRADTRKCFIAEEIDVQVTWTDVNSENDGNYP